MILFVFCSIFALVLVLVYICAIGVLRGISVEKTRVLVVVIGVLSVAFVWLHDVSLREQERMNYDTIITLMNSIQDAIHSGQMAQIAAVLQRQSDQMTENDWQIHCWKAADELDHPAADKK